LNCPTFTKIQTGQFIVRVTGESMNQRIPSGSWCLFRRAPEGTREGSIVLVQHREIQDPVGGALTVKRYQSEKRRTDDGDWQHVRITLSPMSTDSRFRPIVLQADAGVELKVMGEFVAVLEVPG
jgi:SOS-response transcriptional repressor LexA